VYLSEALQSVFDQSYPHWECIIVNDGSPDNTRAIAAQWLQKDPRFKYIEKENGGLSSARNAGIKAAQGDYIQFLDADDVIHPQKFELQLHDATGKPGILISSYLVFYDRLADACPDTWNRLQINNILEDILLKWDNHFAIPIHTALFRKDYFQRHHILFREQVKAKEDWIFWIECLLANPACRLQKDALAYYRQHAESMTTNRLNMFENETIAHFLIYTLLEKNEEKDRFVTQKMQLFVSTLLKEHITANKRIEELAKKRLKYKLLFLVCATALLFASGLLVALHTTGQ
jgi:glycosyltransferase involved in cell wall biosynthesis